MNEALAAQLAELHRDGVEHDAALSDRLQRLRNLEPDSAALLALLVKATRARSILELGTWPSTTCSRTPPRCSSCARS